LLLFTPAYSTEKAINWLSRVIHRVGGIVLAAMMFLTAADVFLRYLFNRPISGALELNENMLVILVFFSVAYTAIQKGHVRVEVLITQLSQKAQSVIEIISGFVTFVLSLMITWQAFVLALEKMEQGLTTAVLFIPVFPFIFMVAFGSGLLSLVLLVDLVHSVDQVVRSHWKILEWLIPLLIMILLGAAIFFGFGSLPSKLSPVQAGYVGFIVLLVLLFSGMPIGFVMALIGFAGMTYLTTMESGLGLLGNVPYSTVNTYSFCVIPLFILMGSFAFYTGLSKDLYGTVYKWLGHFPGGLAMATVGACAGFAAISGSSLATAATMGTVALPEMKRYKYDPALATGCIAAGGSIGILIPPSVVLVIYGILTNEPIGDLFIAGFIPGILEALFYLGTIYIICKIDPRRGPRGERVDLRKKLFALKDTWGIIALFVLVVGGLYFGVFTPTEAAGVGAFGVFFLTLARRKLTFKHFGDSLSDTGKTTAMVFVILIGAMLIGYFLTITRIPYELSNWVANLQMNRYVILVIIILIYLFLGCIMDSLSIILLTIPIFFPVVVKLGFDPIWFGIITVRISEMGLITPPIGMNVFIIKGVAGDVPMYTIFRGIVPFLIADACHVALLVAFPQISLFLLKLLG